MLKSNLKIIMEELRKFYKVYLPFKERYVLGLEEGSVVGRPRCRRYRSWRL